MIKYMMRVKKTATSARYIFNKSERQNGAKEELHFLNCPGQTLDDGPMLKDVHFCFFCFRNLLPVAGTGIYDAPQK